MSSSTTTSLASITKGQIQALPTFQADTSVRDWTRTLAIEALDLYTKGASYEVDVVGDSFKVNKTEDPFILQLKANSFRQGYKNWRQKKSKGARGEVTKLKSQDRERDATLGLDNSSTNLHGLGDGRENIGDQAPKLEIDISLLKSSGGGEGDDFYDKTEPPSPGSLQGEYSLKRSNSFSSNKDQILNIENDEHW